MKQALLLAVLLGLSRAGLICNYNTCNSCANSPICGFAANPDGSGQCTNLVAGLASNNFVTDAYNCPSTSAYSYSDEFARQTVFPLISASNIDGAADATACLVNSGNAFTVKKQSTITCDILGSTCAGYVATSDVQGAIAIAFRGSKATQQYIAQIANYILNLQSNFPAGGSVITYNKNVCFVSSIIQKLQTFDKLWVELNETIHAEIKAHPDYKIWVVGHSLGASQASLAAAWIVHEGWTSSDKVAQYTFGEPRTGNQAFAQAHDNLVPNSFRVVHASDPIPHLPAENPILGDTSPYHHNREVLLIILNNNYLQVWYNNDMSTASFAVQSQPEGPYGLNSVSLLQAAQNLDDHVLYFQDLDTWYQSGCTPL